MDRLRERGLSMRELARQLDYDIAVVSRVINGHRRVRLSEIELFAGALGASLQETSSRFGLGANRKGVPVTMTLHGDGSVVDEDWSETIGGYAFPQGAEAVRALTGGSAQQILDGCTLIVGEKDDAGRALNRMALLEFDDRSRFIGMLQRFFPSADRWHCLVPGREGPEQRSGTVSAVRPVIMILP